MMMERVEVVTVKRNEAVVKHLHGCIVITEVLCEIIIDVETVSSNGMDELLMQMMNPDCAPNYSLTNFNNDSDVRRQTDRDSLSSVSDEPDLSELHDPNSFSIRLSEKAISTRQLDERLGQFNGTDLLPLSRNNSDLSISAMENMDR